MALNTTAETETAKIARGLRERDMELLADLVERFQHRLVRYLLYLTGRREYAEDLARRPGFACCNGAASTTGGSGLIPCIRDRPQFGDQLPPEKAKSRWQQLPCQMIAMLCCSLSSSDPSPFAAAARSEDAMRLAGRLQILPPLYREALLLRFQEDLSLAEMAQVLGAPTTTVTSRIYRGLAALRSAFEEGDSHGG